MVVPSAVALAVREVIEPPPTSEGSVKTTAIESAPAVPLTVGASGSLSRSKPPIKLP